MKQSFYIFVAVFICVALIGCLPKRIPSKGVVNGDAVGDLAKEMDMGDGSESKEDAGELEKDRGETIEAETINPEDVDKKDATDSANPPTDTANPPTDTATVDTVDASEDADQPEPPKTTITKSPDKLVATGSAKFSFECNKQNCTFLCKVDNLCWETCSSGKSYSLSEGEHTFTVKAKDGEQSEEVVGASWTWTIDQTPPTTSFTKTPDQTTNKVTATFEFSCDDPPCTFSCNLDGKGWEICDSGKAYGPLGEGKHIVTVKAIDSVQNEELQPKSYTWTVDTIAPITSIDSGPQKLVNSQNSTVEFSCNQQPCSFKCKLDDELWSDCTSPHVLNDVGVGEHKLQVKASDGLNEELLPKEWSWDVIGWIDVSSGDKHTCGISHLGELWCWGDNEYNQIGTDGVKNPLKISNSTDWQQVEAGSLHTCAIKTDKSLWCWGRNDLGELGLDSGGGPYDKPTKHSDDWQYVNAGSNHTCGIKASDKSLWCWGYNGTGALGEKPSGESKGWLTVSLGGLHTCGIKTDSSLWCWGDNSEGQTGPGGNGATHNQVGSDKKWVGVSSGYFHSCGLTDKNTVWCWGRNAEGQIANGNTNSPVTAVTQIGTLSSWTDLIANGQHVCGFQGTELFCWGWNSEGQIGIGSTGGNIMEVKGVDDSLEFSMASAGGAYNCGIMSDKSLWCWGSNGFAQLGVGTKGGHANAPKRVIMKN